MMMTNNTMSADEYVARRSRSENAGDEDEAARVQVKRRSSSVVVVVDGGFSLVIPERFCA